MGDPSRGLSAPVAKAGLPDPGTSPRRREFSPSPPAGEGLGRGGRAEALGTRPLSPNPSPARGEGRNSCAPAGLPLRGSGTPAGSAARCVGLPRNLPAIQGLQPLSPRGRGVGERGDNRGLGARSPSPPAPPPPGGRGAARQRLPRQGGNSCAPAGHPPCGSGAPAGSTACCVGLSRQPKGTEGRYTLARRRGGRCCRAQGSAARARDRCGVPGLGHGARGPVAATGISFARHR
jgi:hypothetical protein